MSICYKLKLSIKILKKKNSTNILVQCINNVGSSRAKYLIISKHKMPWRINYGIWIEWFKINNKTGLDWFFWNNIHLNIGVGLNNRGIELIYDTYTLNHTTTI